MTTWAASQGDILDLIADALICSANPQLNLSGGVGGEFLRRHGPAMQDFLHGWLRASGLRYASPGTVVPAPPCGSPYRTVLHAVAIDAFYETTTDLIRETYERALALAAESGCRSVVSACLACGYGRATPEIFTEAVKGVVKKSWPGIDRVEFRSTNRELVDTIDLF